MLVDRHAQVARLLLLPGGERAHEGWRFGDDGVAVVEGDAADQVQALQRPGRDDHVVGGGVDAALGEALGHQLAERRQSLSGTVRQHVAAMVENGARKRALEGFHRVRLRRWLAAAKTDQVGADAKRRGVGDGSIGSRIGAVGVPGGEPGGAGRMGHRADSTGAQIPRAPLWGANVSMCAPMTWW